MLLRLLNIIILNTVFLQNKAQQSKSWEVMRKKCPRAQKFYEGEVQKVIGFQISSTPRQFLRVYELTEVVRLAQRANDSSNWERTSAVLKNAAQVFLFRGRKSWFFEVILASLTFWQNSGPFVKISQSPYIPISPTIFLLGEILLGWPNSWFGFSVSCYR